VTAQLRKTPAPPLGIVASIASGFETVNARLELILLPLALDLFLWLGPHLSLKPVLAAVLPGWVNQLVAPPGVDAAAAQNFETMRHELQTILTASAERFNLFAVLSQFPLGLPSLLVRRAPVSAPGDGPLTWLVSSGLEGVLLFVAFWLLGLFLSACYFDAVAQQVRDARINWRLLLKQVWGDWARLTALTAVIILTLGFLSLPLTLLIGLVALLSVAAAQFVAATLAIWLLAYFGFTLPGILLQRRGLFGAAWDSIRLAHTSLPQTLVLYAAVIFIYVGLGQVWSLPPDDSWLLVIGLAGHALVSTALVAAMFAFYQDRFRWWVEMRQTLRAQAQARRDGANRRTKA